MRIVVDTNAIVSMISKISPYRVIITKLLNKEIEMFVSTSILLEYEEVITSKSNKTVAYNFLEFLIQLPNVQMLEPLFNWNLIELDPDDNKFVDIAIICNADYLLTNDRHFNILKSIPFPKVNVINLDDFLTIITK